MTPAEFVAVARSWIGTPYHDQARGPKGAGVDCVGLVLAVALEVGILDGSEPFFTIKPWETTGGAVNEVLPKWLEGLQDWTDNVDAPEEGAVAIFDRANMLPHIGIVSVIDYGGGVKSFGLIHAYTPEGKVIETRMDERWLRRLNTVWRVKGIG